MRKGNLIKMAAPAILSAAMMVSGLPVGAMAADFTEETAVETSVDEFDAAEEATDAFASDEETPFVDDQQAAEDEFAATAEDDLTQNFVKAYEAKCGETPNQFAADAYDAVYIIKAAMEQAGIEDVEDKELNEKLVAAMTEIKVEGVTGTMTWSADGEPTKSAQAVVIKNGVYEEY